MRARSKNDSPETPRSFQVTRKTRHNTDTKYTGSQNHVWDVELNVTNKIEEELKEVDGVDRFTSFSMENISIIRVWIDRDVRHDVALMCHADSVEQPT